MLQQLLAGLIIAFIIFRLFKQKKKKEITPNEFAIWLSFWMIAALAVIFIKQIDNLVAYLGFSGSGINFLIYLAVLVLFYLVFRLRLSIAKLDRSLTDLTRQITLNDKK